MELETYRPIRGRAKKAAVRLLAEAGLTFEENLPFTVCLWEDGALIATGSLDENVLKCIAVSHDYKGEGLSAMVVTALWKEAASRGHSHLFLYTRPENLKLFAGLSFYPVAKAPGVLLMENRRNGLRVFLNGLPKPPAAGVVGAVVANCDPFTLGHRYLMEGAAHACDRLYVFILSEERGMFPAADRLRLAQEGCRDLHNASVHPTGGYLVSSATFPTYFLKDRAAADRVRCGLDIAVFAERFAPALRITRRFVGTEPLCPVTAAYNRAMKEALPQKGIEVVELPRLEIGGAPVSASRVRELYLRGDLRGIAPLVPSATHDYLTQRMGSGAKNLN